MNKISLDCPLPELDYDVITLGHGSGGLLTHKLLDQGVFSLFKNELLDKRHDGAIFNSEGPMAFTTDSYVVSPINFPGGNIGDLAINGTVNDLAMCGAIPKFISVGFILEEGLKMTEFWEILVSMKRAAEHAGVQIITGDTKVVDRGKADKIFINTTGIGPIHPKSNIDANNVQVGDKIIVSGQLANHGVSIMSLREGLQFKSEIKSDTAAVNHIVISILEKFGNQIHLLRDPTRGGVGTVLVEIASGTKSGLTIAQPDLPVDSIVMSACELLGLDPLYVANEGLFIAIASSNIADNLLSQLKTYELSKNAAIIGEVVDEHPGKVVMKSSIGGTRIVSMLPGEQLPRIC